MRFKAILISNQPGVAKKQFSYQEFLRMRNKTKRELAKQGCSLDGEYYCLHHPNGIIRKYNVNCNCRKPKPGLILEASKELEIDLKRSFLVGDSLVDVKAGRAAGCRTILISHMTDFLNRMMEKEDAFPDHMVGSFKDVPRLLQTLELATQQ